MRDYINLVLLRRVILRPKDRQSGRRSWWAYRVLLLLHSSSIFSIWIAYGSTRAARPKEFKRMRMKKTWKCNGCWHLVRLSFVSLFLWLFSSSSSSSQFYDPQIIAFRTQAFALGNENVSLFAVGKSCGESDMHHYYEILWQFINDTTLIPRECVPCVARLHSPESTD